MNTADSPTVFVVKCLLFPIIPVLTLLVCLNAGNESWHGAYFLVAVLTFLGASEFLGIARIGVYESRSHTAYVLADITVRWFVLVGFIALVLYFSGLATALNYGVLTCWMLVTPLTLYIGQSVARYGLLRSRMHPHEPRRAVIVGVTELGVRLERALKTDTLLGTEVAGFFEDRHPDRLQVRGSKPILDTTRGLARYVAGNNIEQVYITLPMNRNPRIMAMLDALNDSTASIYFVPDVFAFNLIQARFDILNGIPLVAVRETPFYGGARLAKRISDVLIASAALLLTLPVLLLVALCIRLDSHGPILFKQKRYGLDGREIMVYKFRSMTVTEDGKDKFKAASRADVRITRIGAFIRKSSLDELPQLLNVLQGTMSIVGPRPHPVAMNEHYRREIPSYMVRHKVKPGITGWAQVNGYRGGDDLESMRKRIEFDLAYLRHWSFWLDLKILLKTVTVIWTDRNAY